MQTAPPTTNPWSKRKNGIMNETSEQYDLRKYVNHLEAHARKLERKLLKARLHVENVEQAVTRRNERIAELEGALRSKREKTSAELIELAWERAYETNRIPAHTPFIFRTSDPCIHTAKGQPRDIYVEDERSRLIDPPAPDPEPWEQSRYCQADGDIYKRLWNASTAYWMRPGDETAYRREDLAKLDPKPVTIE